MPHELHLSAIEACNACATECEHCASACLGEQDVNKLARCIALDLDCAAMCRLAAEFMGRGSEFSAQTCELCTTVCDACAAECEKHPMEHCKECATACRACAAECRRMAQTPAKDSKRASGHP